MKILVLDNYDSFTYNLVQYLMEITGKELEVFRNDAISLAEVDEYDVIILSPGPGLPSEAGIMPDIIKKYGAYKPILGVCLGLQAIGEAYGAKLHNLERVFHGVATSVSITDTEDPVFMDLPASFKAGRYHSWVVKPESLPEVLKVTAVDEAGSIMALRHIEHPVFGLQFHPESIMTEYGKEMLSNFLKEATQINSSLKTIANS